MRPTTKVAVTLVVEELIIAVCRCHKIVVGSLPHVSTFLKSLSVQLEELCAISSPDVAYIVL